MRLQSIPGVGLGLGGFGLGLVAYGVDAIGVHLPDGVLIAAIVLGVLMIVGGIAFEVMAHRHTPTDTPAMFDIGKLGRGIFRRNVGPMLRADRVDRLTVEDSGKADEAKEDKGKGKRRRSPSDRIRRP